MDKSVLDTDIFSELLKGVSTQVTEHARAYRATFGIYTTSAITVFEIVKGLHKVRREARIQQFLHGLAAVEVLTLETPSAELAGRITADLERAGTPIGRADPLIAAIALHHDYVLVTGNTDHYARIQACGYPLRLTNWRS